MLTTVIIRAANEAGVDLAILTQYGVLGVFAILLIIFARLAYKRETDRSDRLEQEVVRLNNLIQEKAIPALESATRAVEQSADLLAAIQREREREYLARRPPHHGGD